MDTSAPAAAKDRDAMHCLVEIDLGWVSDPAAAPMRLAQALLRLPDRQPDRDLRVQGVIEIETMLTS